MDHQKILIAPSLLSADVMRLGAEIADVEAAGADLHHIDVMDGHFVPNLTFGLPLVEALKKSANLPLDVHLMVSNPDAVVADYLAAGADWLSFHVEAAVHAHRLIQTIRKAGKKPGIVVNPGTSVQSIFPLLEDVDYVLLMSVNPGFGGQQFISYTEEKCRILANALVQRSLADKVLIEVDGGITQYTIAKMAIAGVRVFVAGSAIYGKKERCKAIAALRDAAHSRDNSFSVSG
ncbi:MAG: ribulose-phosphate 3-epimerase [Proteobacteria bacterium]|nr:ribulose-phosphate 3-epimerase [Pseudomonadota bacterium]